MYEHGRHNKEVCDYLIKSKKYNDWVITTSFYSALHYLRENIFPVMYEDGTPLSNFEEYYSYLRKNGIEKSQHKALIDLVEKELKEVANLYRQLYTLCRTSRYNNYRTSKKKALRGKSYLDKSLKLLKKKIDEVRPNILTLRRQLNLQTI